MNDIEADLGTLLREGEPGETHTGFDLRMQQGLRRARWAQIIRGAAAVAGIVIASGAGFSLSVIFLDLAKSSIADGPAWDITQAVFWLPYAVVCATLAAFLRELIVRAARRHF